MVYVIKDFYNSWDEYFKNKNKDTTFKKDKEIDLLLSHHPHGPLLNRQERLFFQEEAKKDNFWGCTR